MTEDSSGWLLAVPLANLLQYADILRSTGALSNLSYSMQVHPSGILKAGKDYWVAQAAAGDTFSLTREANWEDASRATEGFLWMKEVRTRTLLRNTIILDGEDAANHCYQYRTAVFAGLVGGLAFPASALCMRCARMLRTSGAHGSRETNRWGNKPCQRSSGTFYRTSFAVPFHHPLHGVHQQWHIGSQQGSQPADVSCFVVKFTHPLLVVS